MTLSLFEIFILSIPAAILVYLYGHVQYKRGWRDGSEKGRRVLGRVVRRESLTRGVWR